MIASNAIDRLKTLLVEAPILVHPDLDKNFTLKTNASAQGLGAVFSQTQDDKRLHPVAYASRALSPQREEVCDHRVRNTCCCVGCAAFSRLLVRARGHGVY